MQRDAGLALPRPGLARAGGRRVRACGFVLARCRGAIGCGRHPDATMLRLPPVAHRGRDGFTATTSARPNGPWSSSSKPPRARWSSAGHGPGWPAPSRTGVRASSAKSACTDRQPLPAAVLGTTDRLRAGRGRSHLGKCERGEHDAVPSPFARSADRPLLLAKSRSDGCHLAESCFTAGAEPADRASLPNVCVVKRSAWTGGLQPERRRIRRVGRGGGGERGSASRSSPRCGGGCGPVWSEIACRRSGARRSGRIGRRSVGSYRAAWSERRSMVEGVRRSRLRDASCGHSDP